MKLISVSKYEYICLNTLVHLMYDIVYIFTLSQLARQLVIKLPEDLIIRILCTNYSTHRI